MSQINIWNLALAHLGDRATVTDPNERSRQAELCKMFYPMTRRSVLEAFDWGFATRAKVLTPSSFDPAALGWSYAFSAPTDHIKIIAVGHGLRGKITKTDYQKIADDAGDTVLLCELQTPMCLYLVDVEDVGRWSPLFTEAVSWLLASHLAGPIITGDSGRAESRRLLEEFRATVSRAALSDANQQRVAGVFDFQPSLLAGRGLLPTDSSLLNVRN